MEGSGKSLSIEDVAQWVEERLGPLLEDALWTLRDDSQKHVNHPLGPQNTQDGVTHCTLTIVSEAFSNMSLLQRHRMVQEALQGDFFEALHSLCLRLETPSLCV